LIFEVAIGSNLGDSERRHQDPVRRPSILFLPAWLKGLSWWLICRCLPYMSGKRCI